MKHFKLMIFLLISMVTTNVWAQQTLSFHNGMFKIAQFTDIHWDAKSDNCTKNRNTIIKVIQTEKPDIAILTGDVVTAEPAEEGWKSIIQIFENEQLPFIVTLGNHDGEVIDKAKIYQILMTSPFYIGDRGPENVSGYGNFAIAVKGSKENDRQPAAVLYCIDSNDYPKVKEYGTYDKINFDEIEWYRSLSDRFTQNNGGKPLPSLAFFHIPLVEYNEIVNNKNFLGSNDEESICAAKINSGLFSSFIDQKDVMGAFCGHDHENDFIGMLYNIALAYGRISGLDTYGKKDRGARIIQLYEGQRKFDTWIRTANQCGDSFYYPSSISSKDEREMTYLPSKGVKPTKQGIHFDYFEGNFKQTDDILPAKKMKEGIMSNFSIKDAKQEDHFAYLFKSLIKIDKRGVYRFYTYSDDGSKLLIDGKVVVDNDGGHSAKRADGMVALEAGYHDIELRYFEDYMGQSLEVGFSSKDIAETVIPNNILFVPSVK